MPLALTMQGSTEYLPETDRESAMMRYWSACQAGDKTAKLVLVERAPDPDPEPDPPPTSPGAVSHLAQKRVAEHERWLDDAGFALAPPLFAPGTRVLPLGDQNFRLERQRIENMPLFGDAVAQVRQVIAEEDRTDSTHQLANLHMNEQGELTNRGDVFEQIPRLVEFPAFYQLAQLSGFGMGVRYLTQGCDPALRAYNVNAQLASRRDRSIVLRMRANSLGRSVVYAVVTPTYAVVDTDEVLLAAEPLLRDAHAEVLYDGNGVSRCG